MQKTTAVNCLLLWASVLTVVVHARPASEDYDRDAVYAYQYSVDDKYSGAKYSADESRAGLVTTGSYTVLLPDGRTKTVTYSVKDPYSGFVADVVYSGEANNPIVFNKPAPSSITYSKPAPAPIIYSQPRKYPEPSFAPKSYPKPSPTPVTYDVPTLSNIYDNAEPITYKEAPKITYTKSSGRKVFSKPVISTFRDIPTSDEALFYTSAEVSPTPYPTSAPALYQSADPSPYPSPAPTLYVTADPKPTPRVYTLHKTVQSGAKPYNPPVFFGKPTPLKYLQSSLIHSNSSPTENFIQDSPVEDTVVKSLANRKGEYKKVPEALVYRSKLNFVS